MKGDLLAERCKAIKLLLTDVDGVLTDGTILVLPDGGEAKAFHVRDGLAIVLAQAAGLKTGLLSGRSAASVAHRAADLKMAVVRQGVRFKGPALVEICAELGIEPREVAYVGDDVNDLPVFAQVGLSAAPADAPLEVRNEAVMSLSAAGGRGCVREFVEAILRARGQWDEVLRTTLGVELS